MGVKLVRRRRIREDPTGPGPDGPPAGRSRGCWGDIVPVRSPTEGTTDKEVEHPECPAPKPLARFLHPRGRVQSPASSAVNTKSSRSRREGGPFGGPESHEDLPTRRPRESG